MAKRAAQPLPTIAPPPILHPQLFDDLRLCTAGADIPKPHIIDHAFAITGIGLVARGRGTYRAGKGETFTLQAPAFFPVYPGPRFRYGPDRDTTWDEYHVCAVGTGVERWTRTGLVPTDGQPHAIDDAVPIIALFDQLLMTYRRGGCGDADRAIVLAEAILVELFHRRLDRKLQPNANPQIESILAYCRDHFDEPINFHALADDHAMSYSLLRQQVRAATGLPPGQFLTRLRVERACRMLTSTDDSVERIGLRVGIDDPFTFSRTFKRCVGLSPRAYRQQRLG